MMMAPVDYSQKKVQVIIVLGLLWIFVTAINLFKPVHIDDGVHLSIAQYIAQNPSHPLSGMVVYDNELTPIHKLNQPSLYFYWLALTGSLCGFDPLLLHLFQSLFALACIILLYKIGVILTPGNALLNTCLIAGSAAFVVNQNLMTDVPLLSTWLAFFYFLFKKGKRPATDHALAGIFLGIAILTKYTSLPLFIVYALAIFYRFPWRQRWMILIPVLFLVGWSVFNVYDYGRIHLLDRPVNTGYSISSLYMKLMSGIVTLGAVVFFTPLVYSNDMEGGSGRWKFWVMIGLTLLFIAFIFISAADLLPHDRKSDFLRGAFILNGLFILWFPLKMSAACIKKFISDPRTENDFILWVWIFSAFLFLVLQAPFQATRHYLLILPALVFLLVRKSHGGLLKWPLFLSLGLTFFFSLGFGIADWRYADFYRSVSRDISASNDESKRNWFTGDWGWRYYMASGGSNQYFSDGEQPRDGELLYMPKVMRNPEISEKIRLVPADTIVSVRAPLFNPAGKGSLYFSTYIYLPWHLNYRPFDTIFVYTVNK